VNLTLVCETSPSTGIMDDTRNECSGLEDHDMTELAEKDTSRRSPFKRPCSDQGYQFPAHVNAALLHCRSNSSNSSNTAMSKRKVRPCVIKLAYVDEQAHHPGRGSGGFISLSKQYLGARNWWCFQQPYTIPCPAPSRRLIHPIRGS
jgi:hypothetical protein